MEWTLEVVVVPVRDVDRAIAFYRDQIGFHLDHDTDAGQMRFAQLTPKGSGCSIVLADPPPMEPGSLRGLQLVVCDAASAQLYLVENGVAAGKINVLDGRDGGTMFEFSDPDGNAWVVQQIKARGEVPLLHQV
jgi:predicted enzyme related to lactoylglutathione lyase